MKILGKIFLAIGSVCVCLTAHAGIFKKEKETKPNVVVFLVDDLGWTDLGCYGSDFYKTPAIDQLAAEGIKFTNAYSSCTVCSPSRASIMTGKSPARMHLTDWIEGHKYPWAKLNVPDWKMYLDTDEYTLAEAFKEAGYYTAHVGKWHLGEDEKDWPENHGFDVNIGGWAKGAPNRNSKKGSKGYFAPYGNPRLSDGPDDEFLTERLTREVCDIIKSKKSEPFFINFWLYNVHMPLQAKQENISKYTALVDSAKQHTNPVYAAMVEHMDEALGAVVAQLKEAGVYENTIILFASDNGGLLGKGKRSITNNYPLRQGKGGMYEGGIRIPTIIYSPFSQLKGVEMDEPVTSEDYFPTLLDMAGVELARKKMKHIDGMSWKPLLDGKLSLKREALYWHYPHYHQEGAVPHSTIRWGQWKLIENFEENQTVLFNLSADIGETNNVADQHPVIASKLKKKLEKWRQSVNAQMPVSNPNYDQIKERKKNKKN